MGHFEEHFAELPLIAILRGVQPAEIEPVAEILLDTGFRLIEVPLNSPSPIESIARLAAFVGDRATVGAGTVLSPSEVDQVAAANGALVVAPNCNRAVIERSVQLGQIPLPGIRTATEAFAAVEAGATVLKFFPCSIASAWEIGALKTVLPLPSRVLAVGGVSEKNIAQFRAAGADGCGIGSNLFAPGRSLDDLRASSAAMVEAWRRP
jgi:2-dehydro-3-deoxyphosphogalactonate aldolase